MRDRPFADTLVVLAAVTVTACTGSSEPQPLPNVEAIVGMQGSGPGRFISPRAVAYDPGRRQLCVADRSGRIQRFVELDEPKPVSEFDPDEDRWSAGWEVANFWHLPEYEVGYPTKLHFQRDGNLLVADTHYHRVLVYDPMTGKLLSSWGEKGHGAGEFDQVRDVVQDSSGAYFAGDYGDYSDRVHKFDPGGRFLFSFGKRGENPAEFQRIQGMAIARSGGSGDGEETLLVADSCNHRIQRFALDGTFLAAWGKLGQGDGEFRYPYGISVEDEPGGDIFVVEWGNNRVQRFDHVGRCLGVWGRAGRGPGELATPWDVQVVPDGRIFVADFNNHRVQVFRWPGEVAWNSTVETAVHTEQAGRLTR